MSLNLRRNCNCSFSLIFFKIINKSSMQIIKCKGDLGSPWLNPLADLEKPFIEPHITKENI